MTKCFITCGQYNLLLSEMQKKFGDRVLTMKLCCNQTTHCHQKQSQLPMTMKQF